MLRWLQRLWWRLTLSYTLTTLAALLLVELALVLALGLIIDPSAAFTESDAEEALHAALDAHLTQPATPDWAGAQRTLEQLAQRGQISSIALVPGQPLVLADARELVRAAAGGAGPTLVGQPVGQALEHDAALLVQYVLRLNAGSTSHAVPRPGDRLWVAAAFERPGAGGREIVAVAWVQVRSAVTAADYLWFLLKLAGWSSLALLAVVAPLGLGFGLLMTRGLTRRIHALAQAAAAYSRGDFRAALEDARPDEIGQLGQRLRAMALQLEQLLRSQRRVAVLEERGRLARELHDTIKQQLFAAELQLHAIRNLIPAGAEQAQGLTADTIALLRQTQQDLRALLQDLRPTELEELGLAAALRAYVASWSRQSGVAAVCEAPEGLALSAPAELALYRVAQEALSNVARHSGAAAARVELRAGTTAVALTVEDDGRGMAGDHERPHGLGLHSMRQRAEALGGALRITTAAPRGVRVVVELPAEQMEQSDGEHDHPDHR